MTSQSMRYETWRRTIACVSWLLSVPGAVGLVLFTSSPGLGLADLVALLFGIAALGLVVFFTVATALPPSRLKFVFWNISAGFHAGVMGLLGYLSISAFYFFGFMVFPAAALAIYAGIVSVISVAQGLFQRRWLHLLAEEVRVEEIRRELAANPVPPP